MVEEISRRFNTDLKGVPCVGDSLRDLTPGAKFGMQSILVRTGKGEQTLAEGGLPDDTWVCADLAEAVNRIIAETV